MAQRETVSAFTVIDNDTGALPVTMYDASGNPLLFATADGQAPARVPLQAIGLYNGTNFDRLRGTAGALYQTLGPLQSTAPIVASRTDTVSGNSADLTAPAGATTLLWVFKVTAISGTSPQITYTIQGKLSDGATYFSQGASSAITTTAVGTIAVTPGNTSSLNLLLPTYRIGWTITGTTPSVTWFADLYWK